MKRSKEIILNSVFLKNRIAELGIKQWWLAEQIGVDRKTVIRWIQGQVKSIQFENIEKLAQSLECSIEVLSLATGAENLATPEDQKNAAQVLATSSIVDKLGPIGEWNVIESLLKATIVANLPANVLGELYNQLTVASWRQNKIKEADLYNKKAEELALRSGDKSVLAGALLSKANLASWSGQITTAIKIYNDCLDLWQYIEPKTIGSTHSNLGAILYEKGELDLGEFHQKKALEIFAFHGKPMNLSIVWCNLAIIYLKKNEVENAQKACDSSIQYAHKDDYRRGLAQGNFIQSEIAARKKQISAAREYLADALTGFEKLGIEEGLNYEFAGRICRLLGDNKMSEIYLRKGIDLSIQFPMEQASIYFELAKTIQIDSKRKDEAVSMAKKSLELFHKCEAPHREEMVNTFLNSIR